MLINLIKDGMPCVVNLDCVREIIVIPSQIDYNKYRVAFVLGREVTQEIPVVSGVSYRKAQAVITCIESAYETGEKVLDLSKIQLGADKINVD